MTLEGELDANRGFKGKLKLSKTVRAKLKNNLVAGRVSQNYGRKKLLEGYHRLEEARNDYKSNLEKLSIAELTEEVRIWLNLKKSKETFKEITKIEPDKVSEAVVNEFKDDFMDELARSSLLPKDFVPSCRDIRSGLIKDRKEFPENWKVLYGDGLNATAYAAAIDTNLENAKKNFHDRFPENLQRVRKKMKETKKTFRYPQDYGFPQYKRKDKSAHLNQIPVENIDYENNKILVAKIGWVQVCKGQKIPKFKYPSKTIKPVISTDGIDYFLSFNYYKDVEKLDKPVTEPIGIDLGFKDLAICSDGTKYENIGNDDKIKKLNKKIEYYQTEISKLIDGKSSKYKEINDKLEQLTKDRRAYSLSVKDKESEEYKTRIQEFVDARNKLQKDKYQHDMSCKIKRLRRALTRAWIKLDNYKKYKRHYIAVDIIKKNPAGIVFEKLNVKGMQGDKDFSKSVQKTGMRELKSCIIHHADKHGIIVKEVPETFASTQTCSVCGEINEGMKGKENLNKRIFICPYCGAKIDRDVNAAINLKNQFYKNIKIISSEKSM